MLADVSQTLQYINGGGSGWAGVLPVFEFAAERGFNINLSPYLSSLGEEVMSADQNAYIGDLVGGFNYMQQLLKPQYANFTQVPAFARVLAALKMGQGTPNAPIFLGNGEGVLANGYDGDGVMVTTAVTALAEKYCQEGVPVEYQEYPGIEPRRGCGTVPRLRGPVPARSVPGRPRRVELLGRRDRQRTKCLPRRQHVQLELAHGQLHGHLVGGRDGLVLGLYHRNMGAAAAQVHVRQFELLVGDHRQRWRRAVRRRTRGRSVPATSTES